MNVISDLSTLIVSVRSSPRKLIVNDDGIKKTWRLFFIGKVLFWIFLVSGSRSEAKVPLCAVSAETEVRKLAKSDKEFQCAKFSVGSQLSDFNSSMLVETFEVNARCANPGVWLKYNVVVRKQSKKCKIIDIKIISRSS